MSSGEQTEKFVIMKNCARQAKEIDFDFRSNHTRLYFCTSSYKLSVGIRASRHGVKKKRNWTIGLLDPWTLDYILDHFWTIFQTIS